METLIQDVRYGVRMLLKSPGFTSVAVLALALGIGANSALFSIVNAVLLRPLPYENSERLVKVWATTVKKPDGEAPSSFPNYQDWRSQNQVFDEMGAYSHWFYNISGTSQPEQVQAVNVSASLFPLLGVSPQLGRNFLPEEDQKGAGKAVILSNGLWQRRFNSDPAVVGKPVTLSGESYTVVGVMAADFKFPSSDTALWVPLAIDPEEYGRMDLFLDVVARLKPGVTLEQAHLNMETIARQLEQQYPATNTDWRVRLVPLHEQIVGKTRPLLLVLLGAVAFVLLIACANVANLLLARAAGRQKEIAIRTALGASRLRVIRQLLSESILLALVGGLLGLLVALWGADALIALSPESIPRAQEIGIDARVLGFTFAVSLLTGLIFGLAPAVQASKPDLNETLKEGGRGVSSGLARQRVRSALVVAEVALALVLLVGAGLLIKSFLHLMNQSAGFNAENVLVLDIGLPQVKYPQRKQWSAFFQEALGRIESLPAVQSVGATTALPLSNNNNLRLIYIEGRPHAGPQDYTASGYRIVNPAYFKTLGIPLMSGRDLTEQDRDGAPPVAVINQAFARRFFPDEDPIGKRMKAAAGPESPQPWLTIAGVVGDVKHSSLEEETKPEMYVPYLQSPLPFMTLAIRTARDPLSLAGAVRNEVLAVDKDQPIANVKAMEQLVSEAAGERRFNMLLLGIFAVVALVLAAVGIYGVMSYSVTQRTHEIGIRMALGATSTNVLRLVVGQGMILSLSGVAVGLIGAFLLTRVMEGLLYQVSATDPATFITISALLVGVALLASYIPARRATRVDPMVALRYE